MKRIIIVMISLLLLACAFVGCKSNEGGDEINVIPDYIPDCSTTPLQVVNSFGVDASVSQLGVDTWNALLNEEFETVYSTFIGVGYTEMNVPTVTGKKDKMKVVAAGDKIVTLYQKENEVQVVWDVCHGDTYSLLYANEQTGKGEVTFAQIGVKRGATTDNPGIGMCYVYKLSNGSAMIVDGGNYGNEVNIYSALQVLNVSRDSAGRYMISAWILTHGHVDHYGAFVGFLNQYGSNAIIENVVYSLPIDESILSPADCNVSAIVSLIKEKYPGAVHVTPHAGLKYHFDNITVSMLYSPEMLSTINYTNNTSLIFVVECAGARVLQTGDAGEAAAMMCWYLYDEEAFRADLLQITHHGLYTGAFNSLSWEYLGYIYSATKATYGLLPMGTRSPVDTRNGRYTVINEWARSGYQTAYLVDGRETETNFLVYNQFDYDDFVLDVALGNENRTLYGYDGKNILVNEEGLVTYIMCSETHEMATVFTLSNKGAKLVLNRMFDDWAC